MMPGPNPQSASPPNSHPGEAAGRADLLGAIDLFLDALRARDPLRLPLAREVIFTENNVQLMLGDGLWNTIGAVDRGYDLRAADPQTGQACWFGVIEEADEAAAAALRLRLAGGLICEIELIVCRPSELGPFPQIDPLSRPRPVMLADVPPAQRTSRERMIALANGYFDTLQRNDGRLFTHFTPDCDRIENGLQTTNTDIEGYPIARMGTEAQFRLGQYLYDDRVRDRRFPLADEQKGLVLAAGFIDHSGRIRDVVWTDGTRQRSIFHAPHSFVLLELFKIVEGAIAGVEAVFITVPYNMVSPWLAPQPYVVR